MSRPSELNEVPSGEFTDDSYVSRPGNKGEALGVISDREKIEDRINANQADTDAQLGTFYFSHRGPSTFQMHT